MKYRIKSKTNLITNSSSEVFVIRKPLGKSKEEIQEELEKYHQGVCNSEIPYQDFYKLPYDEKLNMDLPGGGMGGILEVEDFTDRYKEELNSIPWTKRDKYTKEIYSLQYTDNLEDLEEFLWIDVDELFCSTCKYIFENFEVLEYDAGYVIGMYDREGEKVISVVSPEEWRELSDLQKNGKRSAPEEYEDDGIEAINYFGNVSFTIKNPGEVNLKERMMRELKLSEDEIYVYTFQDECEYDKRFLPKSKRHLYTPEVHSLKSCESYEDLKDSLLVCVDECREDAFDYIIKNFEVISVFGGNDCYPIYDKTGEKIIKIVNWDEWLELGDLERNGKL